MPKSRGSGWAGGRLQVSSPEVRDQREDRACHDARDEVEAVDRRAEVLDRLEGRASAGTAMISQSQPIFFSRSWTAMPIASETTTIAAKTGNPICVLLFRDLYRL
jgi:hypothetical protein